MLINFMLIKKSFAIVVIKFVLALWMNVVDQKSE